jgi:putative DNA primase/helicase
VLSGIEALTIAVDNDTRQHARGDYITKTTAVPPGGACPLWLAFVERIAGGDYGLVGFLQRAAGYALTGCTMENALFFLCGTGANGKSVFLNTLAGVLGEYAIAAPIETFIASSSDRHPTELAALRGARLVAAVETEEGRRWAEARIKQLTGGDKIAARYMRQDYFEFQPEFKLVIAGNHRPGLRGVDEAIRRRMNLIPFTVTIPTEERDDRLAEKLRAEWPGILAWAIRGCLDWQTGGLSRPEAVTRATAEYLESEDIFSAWLSECCSVTPHCWTSIAELWGSWKGWADRAGEIVGSTKSFSRTMQNRGFAPKRQAGTGRRGFLGISIIPSDSATRLSAVV